MIWWPISTRPISASIAPRPKASALIARFSRRQAGAQRLGLSLWELLPGEAAYPYHFHLVDEELVVVLEGRPSLRTPDGWRDLERGETHPSLQASRALISSSTGDRRPSGSFRSAAPAFPTS
jgi:hypothetical protein